MQVKDPVNGLFKYSLLCEERYRGAVFKMDDCLVPSMNDARKLLKKHMKHRLRASSTHTEPAKASLSYTLWKFEHSNSNFGVGKSLEIWNRVTIQEKCLQNSIHADQEKKAGGQTYSYLRWRQRPFRHSWMPRRSTSSREPSQKMLSSDMTAKGCASIAVVVGPRLQICTELVQIPIVWILRPSAWRVVMSAV